MVYKPKKTVNGHKRNDRDTRRRKRVKARRERAARKPVRSNIKRYVADQLDKIAPDNRYYFNVTEASADKIKPICQSTTRIYPFGASFQKRFLNMEFRRMLPVVKQGLAQYPHLGAHENLTGLPVPAHFVGTSYQTDETHLRNTAGNYNNWRSVIGRGIHMKSSSVYGTITLFPNKDMATSLKDQLHTADLTLHMFVLEDKAVTKTAFMDWYQDLFDAKQTDGRFYTETYSRVDANLGTSAALTEDSWKGDMSFVPYRAGSSYVSNLPTVVATPTANSSNKFVASGTTATDANKPGEYFPTSTGDEEFLIDWRKFYKHDANNKTDELFHNTIPCTSSWDGSYDHSVLPINKSRFIVHEHKKWSFKPDSRGNVRQCIPWSYSFPEHYMTYEKQLLDLPFYYANNSASTDKQGIQTSLLFPRKQPYIVFCWSRCSSQGPRHVPNHNDESGFKDSSNNAIGHQDVFHIDMNMKCHYENPLATKNVPTINKGKPLVHKRESAPARQPGPKRDAPMDPLSRKYQQRKVTRVTSGASTAPVGKKSNTYIGSDGNRYHTSDAPPPQFRNAKRGAPFTGPDGKKSKTTVSSIISSAWEGIKAHPLVTAEVIGFGAAMVLAPELAPMIGRVFYSMGPTAARQFAQGSILRGIGQRASMQGYERIAVLSNAGEGYFVPAGTELADIYEAEHAATGFVRGLPTMPSRATADYGYESFSSYNRKWLQNQLQDVLVE